MSAPALGRPRGLRRRRATARIGLVTYWFNRGQATAMRMVRRALEDAGYETYVLARPTTATFTKAHFIATDDVWDQPRVTPASSFEIPAEEYRSWARANRLDAVLFFQNKDFDAISALREAGWATAGTFMWENFPQADVPGALAAYDCLYALNPWSLQRYADLGIPRTHDVPFAIHPDEALEATGGRGPTTFMFVGGYLSDRKPLGAVVDAYLAGAGPDTRLVVKTQRPIRPGDLVLPRDVDDLRNRYKADPKDAVAPPLSERDPRITTITDDLSSAEHHRLVSDADVLVGVSRWEGLGLHLYEAEPSGKCVLINDMEPYTSYAADRGNCVMSTSHVIGELRETPVHEPDHDSLAAAFAALSEPGAAAARPEPGLGAERWSAFSASLDGLVHTLLDWSRPVARLGNMSRCSRLAPGMTTSTVASASGTFSIGGDLEVTRLGFGAMRITGDGIWGPPADRDEALAVLRKLPELGVDLVDTANSYGPYVSEELIKEALHPYAEGTVVATKAGLTRQGPNQWTPVGAPAYLRQEVEMSLQRLGLERIDLFQLHRIDAHYPLADQVGELKALQDEGKIRHIGLSEVTVEELVEAQQTAPIASVQNRYNVGNREAEALLDHCEEHGIGFIPWSPLAAAGLSGDDSVLGAAAERHSATPSQIALAWLLRRSPVMLPIPGTSKVSHLEANTAAAQIELSDEEFEAIATEAAA